MAAIDNNLAHLQAECRRLTEALALAERERQLLGYEIHDGVVQDLAAAAMLLEGAGRQANFASPEAQQSYARGVRLLQETIPAARRLVQGAAAVEPDDSGFASALARLVDKFQADRGLPVALACDVAELKLSGSIQHLLLRIVQESLYNAWKHARASEVEVRLGASGDKLELIISDNGIGFDPGQVPTGHFGLDGIRARARVLGANLLLDTAPNHGTRIVVQLTMPSAV